MCLFVLSIGWESLYILLNFPQARIFQQLDWEACWKAPWYTSLDFLCLEIRIRRHGVSPLLVAVLETHADHGDIKCLGSRVRNIFSFFLIKTQAMQLFQRKICKMRSSLRKHQIFFIMRYNLLYSFKSLVCRNMSCKAGSNCKRNIYIQVCRKIIL